MKAMVLTKFGAPDMLQMQEVATPTPKDHEVQIRIFATTVTSADCDVRGLAFPLVLRPLVRLYFGRIRPKPLILGQEVSGIVEAVGREVTRFQRGDHVFAWCGLHLGAYAEFICLREDALMAIIPAYMTYEEAAALPIGGIEATHFMLKANIQHGQKVLINGAGGSIGTFAIQLARYFGAEVTGVDSAGKLDLVRALGADHVIDYMQADFTKNGITYDVIFDVVGKSSFGRSFRSLTPNGRYLLGNPRLFQRLRGRWVSRRGGKLVIPWAERSASENVADLAFLIDLMESGTVKSVIDRRFPLEHIAAAHRYVDQGLKRGIVIITVDENHAAQ